MKEDFKEFSELSIHELKQKLDESREHERINSQISQAIEREFRNKLIQVGADIRSEAIAPPLPPPPPKIKKTQSQSMALAFSSVAILLSAGSLFLEVFGGFHVEGIPGWTVLTILVGAAALFSVFLVTVLVCLGSSAWAIFISKNQQQVISYPITTELPENFDDRSPFEGVPVINGDGRMPKQVRPVTGIPSMDMRLSELEKGTTEYGI